MSRYLIVGGAGFIGCNFAEALLRRGDKVIIFDNLSRQGTIHNLTYLMENFPSVEYVIDDIRSTQSKLSELVEEVDVVYHLAAQPAVTTSVKSPREDFKINALGTFNLMEALRKSDRKPPVIYASTNKVYGKIKDLVIKETDKRYKSSFIGITEEYPLDFHSPYGCSKGSGDQYVRDYARIYGLQTVVMRQSCIYGKRQYGAEDQGWISWFIIAAIFGRQINICGNGKQVRDILYVEDLFEAWDLVTKNIDTTSGEIYNVGGGNNFTLSLLEFIDILEDYLDMKVDFSYSDWRPGDQLCYISSISKISRDVGWKPKTDIRNILHELITWTEDNIYLKGTRSGE